MINQYDFVVKMNLYGIVCIMPPWVLHLVFGYENFAWRKTSLCSNLRTK